MTGTNNGTAVLKNRQAISTTSLTPAEREILRRIPDQVEAVYDPSFELKLTEKKLFGEQAEPISIPEWVQFPEVDEELPKRSVGRTRLRAKDEVTLFLRYNYARYRLGKLIEAQNRRKSPRRARQMIMWYKRAMRARADIVQANMALVVAMAKRTRISNVEFTELISEGNMALLRAVEKFDVSRGFKFSTYACRAILKGFNRIASKTIRYRKYFPTEYDPALERSDYDVMKNEMQRNDSIELVREILSRNRASLSDLEQTIVMERFAIGFDGKRRTLAEVGRKVGLTNERVRQIQKAALQKIRNVLEEKYLVA